MGRAWTMDTPTKLGVTSGSDMQFAERVTTAETEGTYIHGRSESSKHTLSESEGGVV